mgnify:CR=1 FL=1
MATQSKVVIYNPTTNQHEPLAAGDTLEAIYNNASILPLDATKARVFQSTTKVVLELI